VRHSCIRGPISLGSALVVVMSLSLSVAAGATSTARLDECIRQLSLIYPAYDAEREIIKMGADALPELRRLLNDKTLPDLEGVKQPARYQAELILAEMGPAARSAVPDLLSTLADQTNDEGLRWGAALALGKIGADAEQVVPALAAVLDEPAVRTTNLECYVVSALDAFGKEAAPAVPALRRALESSHSSTIRAVLQRIEGVPPHREKEEQGIREVLIRAWSSRAKEPGFAGVPLIEILWVSDDQVEGFLVARTPSLSLDFDFEVRRSESGWRVTKLEPHVSLGGM
jgi:hypothetical protein